LANIRHWTHLKMGNEQGQVWVKGFTGAEIASREVLSIPHKELYREVGAKLYKLNSRLPDRNIPALLWTSINRAIAIASPSFNHNFFGISERVKIALVPSEREQPVLAQLVRLEELGAYLQTAPKTRLKPIKWLIVGTKALLLGTPVLPLNGRSYWRYGAFLLPAGFQPEPALLLASLSKRLDPENQYWTLIKEEGSYIQAKKAYFKSLTLSSFRLSMHPKDHADESN